ncbi:hypothetical protein [Dyadobacter fermentans]|uniref:hypothetical protein n=1 Tax=Dyadobacter fermentans TaxID=94254 RepID=UPI001CBE881C|nr:hypothetical protein [Dyadobacter fermentans]MBZ1363041.1 hypothetical protein [Dyadobacter fermentans]
MKKFTSVTEAFTWWATNIYPTLEPAKKTGALKNAWRDHTYNLGISEKRMKEVLSQFGKVKVRTIVEFTPD